MSRGVLKILLDQGFPGPPGFNPAELDATVEYVRLFDLDRRLSDESTPDWLIVLTAAQREFDVLVTDDAAMVTEDITLTALCLTSLNLVTWEGGMTSPVTRWAQLLAYTPEIRRRLGVAPPAIVTLPSVRLDSRRIVQASSIIDKTASVAGTTGREVRARYRAEIIHQLVGRRRRDLLDFLND